MAVNAQIDWWNNTTEQDLMQDLMTEAIQFYGMDVVYLPRTMRREDRLYNEDVLSQFTTTYPLEVYIKSTGGWEGQGNFLDKFGLQIEHTVTVMVSRERFPEAVPALTRPTEGDWVYFPQPINKLFEVRFVENEKAQGQFYQLGSRTFYEIQLELYTYGHEEIRTGNTDIDFFETAHAYLQVLSVSAGGSGTYANSETVYQGTSVALATATGVVASWNVNTTTLRVTDITGAFANGSAVVGVTSGATWTLGETPNVLVNPNDTTEDNTYLDEVDDVIINERDGDPFAGY